MASALMVVVGCGSSTSAPEPRRPAGQGPPATVRPPTFSTNDASWGRFHSKRLQLSVPLPDGRSWRIDDHSGPSLVAEHAGTASRVTIATTNEEGLVNRHRCEVRARALGFVPEGSLTTVDDEAVTFPDAYDSRVWIALDAGASSGRLTGHVFVFGAFLRRCLFVDVASTVPSAAEEDVLSSRLAIARARIVGGLKLDPLRTTDDASVPRDRPDIRR
jgi:hypothetical protein